MTSTTHNLDVYKASSEQEWSDAIRTVLEQPPSALGYRLSLMSLAFAGLFGVWAWVGRIQEVAKSAGKIIPKGDTYKIEPAIAGEIDTVLAKEGETVQKGELLFELDSDSIKSEIARLEQTLSATMQELSQARHLIEKIKAESIVHQQMSASSIQAQLAVWEQSKTSAQTSQALLEDMNTEAMVHEERLARLARLEAQGAISKEHLFEVTRDVTQQKRAILQTQGELDLEQVEAERISAELERTQTEALQIQLTAQQSLQKAITEATRLEAAITDIELQLHEARNRLMQTQVRSPADGIISSLAIDNVGEFAQAGSTLVEIVPTETPLVVSTVVLPQKAGLIEPGMDVKIKLDAFPYQNYGVFSGIVTSISPDATSADNTLGLAGATAVSGYQVEVALEQDYVTHEGKPVQLQIGQTASTEIVIRQRRIIDLVLDPIRRLRADELTL